MSLRITAYSHAAFAYNADVSYYPGQIVLLTGDNYNAIPVSYMSYKSRRDARSVLSTEVIALANLLDNTLAIRKQLEFNLRKLIAVHILTESKRLFYIISKGGRSSKRRVMLGIYAARQA